MKKIYCLLLTILVISCSDNSNLSDQDKKSSKPIDPITKYDEILNVKGIKLMWNTAKVVTNTGLIEVSYFDNGKIINPTVTKNPKAMGKSKILISGDKLSIIFYIPSEKSKPKIKDINIANYVSSKFDGEIIIEDILSAKMSKLTLKEGLIVSKIKLSKTSGSSTSKLVQVIICYPAYLSELDGATGEYHLVYVREAYCSYDWIDDGTSEEGTPGIPSGNPGNMSGTTISYQPFYSYESGPDIENFYPTMTTQFRACLPKLGDNLSFVQQISNITNTSQANITNTFYYGSGPKILVDQLDNIYSSSTVYAFDGSYIYIDLDYAIAFNNSGGNNGNFTKIFFGLVVLQDGVNGFNFSNTIDHTFTYADGYRIAVDSYGNLICTVN